MDKLRGYLRVGVFTTWNIIRHWLSGARTLWLEGRVDGGRFLNWARNFDYRPAGYETPKTIEELAVLVKGTDQIRVFGSGHSFNAGVVTEGTLVSLDRLSGVRALGSGQFAVLGGTRIRDVVQELDRQGMAFSALPSHDAQSIGGILSSDVHGTGRDWGFVSEHLVRLSVMDGQGEVHECGPSDDLFRAAIGGVGRAPVAYVLFFTPGVRPGSTDLPPRSRRRPPAPA